MSGSMRRKTSLASASLNLIVLASLAGSSAQAAPAGELARQGSSSLLSGQVTVWTPLVRQRREAKLESKPKKNPSKPEKKKGEAAFELDCLAAHNKWRRLHGAPELVVDKKITKFAQKRADFIAKSDGDEFKHPADLDYGENLAWHSVSAKSCHDLVKMWYDEIELYDFKRSKFDHETGHFTQLVWRDTTRVGCARAISSGPRGGIYLVCNYDPPGNFLGEERGNVLERIGSQARDLASTPVASKPSTTSTLAPPATTQIAVSSTTTVSPTTYSSSTEKPKKKKTTTTKKKSNKKKKSKKGKKKKKKQGNKKAKLTTTVRVPDDLLSL